MTPSLSLKHCLSVTPGGRERRATRLAAPGGCSSQRRERHTRSTAYDLGGSVNTMSEELITEDRPRIKYCCTRIGSFMLPALEEELQALAHLMSSLETLGACPILNDGKVGGNCAVRLDHALHTERQQAAVGGECLSDRRAEEGGSTLLISRSGKAPGTTLMACDFVAVDDFSRDTWSASFRSASDEVRPSSDTPLLWASLGPGATDRYDWPGPPPNVAVHGHALATGDGLRYAERDIPVSSRETLFSTPEDLKELEDLLRAYPYPSHRCYIRKGHGFFVLAHNVADAKATIDDLILPYLSNTISPPPPVQQEPGKEECRV